MFLQMPYTIESCCRLLTKCFFAINFKSDYQMYTFPVLSTAEAAQEALTDMPPRSEEVSRRVY